MKTSNKYMMLAMGAVLALSSCSENSWNDHLDGFEVPPVDGTIGNEAYTLTPENYKTISTLAANVAIAKERGEEAALEAIGNNACFATDEEARRYIPALLADPDVDLPYYTLNNNSSVEVSYNVSSSLPQVVKDINSGVLTYTLDEADYQSVWGSSTDFIEAFAPSHLPGASVPGILADNLEPADGQYAVASYNYTNVEPDFGGTPVIPDQPAFELTSVLGSCTEGQNISVNGIVTAIDARGFILTDNSGSILCYQNSGFDPESVVIGSQVSITGEVSVYNRGLQLTLTDNWNVAGKQTYTYPAAKEVSGADMDAAVAGTENIHPELVTFVGKLSISGNYYNIAVDGAETAVGSLYMLPNMYKDALEDGATYSFTGYFMAVSGSGKYYNIVLVNATAPVTKALRRAAANGAVAETGLYKYSGGSWALAKDAFVLQPDTYKAMGLTYANLSGSQPDQYLPIYLKTNFPYAQSGDVKTVVYYYHTSDGNFYQARQYSFDGSGWNPVLGSSTSKFSKMDDNWQYNPSIEITLPYQRNTDPSYTYYMACVNWVLDNIVKPENPSATLTTATPLIDYRGNAEFYSGASAFYGNVDVRASSATGHVPEGVTWYDGLDDEAISLLMKKRFCLETMRGALETLHPDMQPVEGMEVTFTVNFTSYAPAITTETVVYTVSGKGQYKYKSCTWFKKGEDKGWE